MENNEEPEVLIKKAEKLLTPGFFKALFSNVNDRLEKAAEYYNEAGEAYKLKKEWEKAGDCFIEVAKINEGLKEDILDPYDKAIICFKKVGKFEKYNSILNKLIKLNLNHNNYSKAGELTFEITQNLIKKNLNSNNSTEIKNILNSFDQILDYFKMDKNSNKSTINTVKKAKADFICIKGIKDEFDVAKFIYEELAQELLTNDYLKFQAKEYYAKNILLLLAYEDSISAKAYLHRYYNEDSSFRKSDLGKFLENIILCMENKGRDITDEDIIENKNEPLNFEKAVNIYKAKIKDPKLWDDWKDNILKIIKDKINELYKESDDVYDEDLK